MSQIFHNITSTIGRTPIVKVNRIAPPNIQLYVKLEAFNPGGSVKDRMALGLIEAAEQAGQLRPGQTVVEATSGNTGIALAMVCAQRGYPFVAVMAENFSIERRKLMRFLGAKVVLTPASERGSGMLAKAAELAVEHGWFLPRQFENEANADVHSRTTAPEILEAFRDHRLDYWVTGTGTGGTLKGVARTLRRTLPDIRIVVAEPDNSPLLASGILQDKDADGVPRAPHPAFRPHLMQGWGPDFIPALTEEAVALGLIDGIIPVSGKRALAVAKELASREGILAGISGGATLAAALDLAETAPHGSRILAMLPDTGERYLSTPLFAEIPVHMTEEELAISRSTPRFRFDANGAPAKPSAAAELAPPDPWAVTFVEDAVSDANAPVVMFALEWCEFCWSVRRMFAHFGISFRSIDLDSVDYQAGNRGGAIRNALAHRTSIRTIPQIFIGGEFVGGSTDLFDAWRNGRAQALLNKAGIAFRETLKDDPYGFFPAWLHPRG
jgi:cysteine synthase A